MSEPQNEEWRPAADRDEWLRIREARARAHGRRTPVNRSEYVAERLAQISQGQPPGHRLGTKLELRNLCEVSVGTFNEGVKLAQSRGYITSRSGPGGGIFVAELPPIVLLGNSVLALDGDAASVADAVRMRDALDPLLVDDALWHSSATDIRDLKSLLRDMATARDDGDGTAFVRANWALHARIAQISPSEMIKSVYLSLLEIVESQTLSVSGTATAPLLDYIAERFRLHERLVDAIESRDSDQAQQLLNEHANAVRPGALETSPW